MTLLYEPRPTLTPLVSPSVHLHRLGPAHDVADRLRRILVLEKNPVYLRH